MEARESCPLPDSRALCKVRSQLKGSRSPFNSSAAQLLALQLFTDSNPGDRSWQLESFCFPQHATACEFHALPPSFLEGRFQFGGDFDTMHASLQKLACVIHSKTRQTRMKGEALGFHAAFSFLWAQLTCWCF